MLRNSEISKNRGVDREKWNVLVAQQAAINELKNSSNLNPQVQLRFNFENAVSSKLNVLIKQARI